MDLKKVWMSPDTEKKSIYGYRMIGGIFGIVLLMTLLICGGTFLSMSFGGSQKLFSYFPLIFLKISYCRSNSASSSVNSPFASNIRSIACAGSIV